MYEILIGNGVETSLIFVDGTARDHKSADILSAKNTWTHQIADFIKPVPSSIQHITASKHGTDHSVQAYRKHYSTWSTEVVPEAKIVQLCKPENISTRISPILVRIPIQHPILCISDLSHFLLHFPTMSKFAHRDWCSFSVISKIILVSDWETSLFECVLLILIFKNRLVQW